MRVIYFYAVEKISTVQVNVTLFIHIKSLICRTANQITIAYPQFLLLCLVRSLHLVFLRGQGHERLGQGHQLSLHFGQLLLVVCATTVSLTDKYNNKLVHIHPVFTMSICQIIWATTSRYRNRVLNGTEWLFAESIQNNWNHLSSTTANTPTSITSSQ